MICSRNGSKWGIKPSKTSMVADVHAIILNATDFIVVCGYNFSPFNAPDSIIPQLILKRRSGVAVLIIMPPRMWGFGNVNHVNNIQYLIDNGIGVILNSNNHSKWMVSDYGYYYGSLNFTNASMTKMIEVVTFSLVLKQQPPYWMVLTYKELLNFSLEELNRFNKKKAQKNLNTVNQVALRSLRLMLGLVHRYNPEIEKVERTLLKYENVKTMLSTVVDCYFPLVSIKDLNDIWQQINNIIYTLDDLANKGNDILLKNEWEKNSSINPDDIQVYNRLHDTFKTQITDLSTTISQQILQENYQTELISRNLQIAKKIKDNQDN